MLPSWNLIPHGKIKKSQQVKILRKSLKILIQIKGLKRTTKINLVGIYFGYNVSFGSTFGNNQYLEESTPIDQMSPDSFAFSQS